MSGTKNRRVSLNWLSRLLVLAMVLYGGVAQAFTLQVVDGSNSPVSGFRWLLEEDTSTLAVPGALVSDSITNSIHKSYAPVVTKGHAASSSAVVEVPTDRRYVVSVLPDVGYSMSGTVVPAATDFDYKGDTITVTVQQHAIPTAQFSVFVFIDHNPINNAPDAAEAGLAGASVLVDDTFGGLSQDVFGNPLGTSYVQTCDSTGQNPGSGTEFCLDIEGSPEVETFGNGTIITGTDGMAIVKFLAPGKYGVKVVPPTRFDSLGNVVAWQQTATIEGTPTIDAWAKANEPEKFIEGFGASTTHVAFGFVNPGLGNATSVPAIPSFPFIETDSATPHPNYSPILNPADRTGNVIEGRIWINHFSRPPRLQGFFKGAPVNECWIGLNDPATGQGLYAAQCIQDPEDPENSNYFRIENVPPGSYQLVTWDKPLDTLFGFNSVTVVDTDVDLGDMLVFRWFGTQEGFVFLDTNKNGIMDVTETGIPEQNINLRFRNGVIYQGQPTGPDGDYAFEEVFPFFKWLVTEVDFARFKATGMTAIIDYGGDPVGLDGRAVGQLAPQPQDPADPANPLGTLWSRTEQGEVLTQAVQTYLTQTNIIDWGKSEYGASENGGISGIVYYATTRAENDPRQAVGDPWEPGIPRVVINLYRDLDGNGIIDDLDGDGLPTPADVDNYPFGWLDGGALGEEDIDHNGNGKWNPGDAINVGSTDSWDDNMPTGCVRESVPIIHGQEADPCADSFGTWNQVRPGVFDGGYAFNSYFPGGIGNNLDGSGRPIYDNEVGGGIPTGTYIVEAATPPGYELVKEEDKNVDFGDTYIPSSQAIPAVCVGDLRTVPAELVLFPGIPAPFATSNRPLCNRKQIIAAEAKNAAVDFFYYTEVPKTARIVGFTNNDLSAEFDPTSPVYGEKSTPSFIPVSIQDWAGKELVRIYTDEYGHYNALVPSTYTVNVPSAAGLSPNMLTVVLNHPTLADGSLDPYYDPNFSVTPWTLHYTPGHVTYLDTPLVAVASFSQYPPGGLDAAQPEGTPVLKAVSGSAAEGGVLVCSDRPEEGRRVTLTALGSTVVRNPDYNPADPTSPFNITRDYGFGTVVGSVTFNDGGDPITLKLISWAPGRIVAEVPAEVTTSGQLMVTRGDNGRPTATGMTLTIEDCGVPGTVLTVPGLYPTIQAAIDAADTPGQLILVAPGTYNEMIIMYKPVRLQGAGAGQTIINATPFPSEKLAAWHAKTRTIQGLPADGLPIFRANEGAGILVTGLPGDAIPEDQRGDFTLGEARIDGFTINGALAGGGIDVNNDAPNLIISNNKITNNQGNYGGGIVLGIPDTGAPANNTDVVIRNNEIVKNGGIRGPAGIAIYFGCDNYLIENNLISGNLSQFSGGGIGHMSLSDGGIIRNNRILFNEVYSGLNLAGAGDGAGIFVGSEPVIDPQAPGVVIPAPGSGNVEISNNLIQGNLAGIGHGGGIRASAVNADNVDNPDALSYQLSIINNMIVNNVAGLDGGGISLQDAAFVNIVNNTVANNDSTATGLLAFVPGSLDSTPQTAGIMAFAHSAALTAALLGQDGPAPNIVNNIILHNRSFYFRNDPVTGTGALAENPAGLNQDLLVQGNPLPLVANNLLTDAAPFPDAGNISYDPTGSPVFVREYFNDLQTALTLDEGGNFINVSYSTLNTLLGNYHLRASSPALDAGDATADGVPGDDIDGQERPNGALDLGADEFYPVPPTQIGVWRQGFWYLDQDGSGTWEAASDIRSEKLSLTASQPVTADWDGDGRTEVGFFSQGNWYLDRNGDGVWSGDGIDEVLASFGAVTDLGVTADIDDDGTVELGVYRPSTGMWYFDLNNDGWTGCEADLGTDRCLGPFGAPGDLPVVANMDADTTPEIGVFRPSTGQWYFDLDNDGWTQCLADSGTDLCAGPFGAPTDLPVAGDIDNDGTAEIGVYRPSTGQWYFDLDNDGWTQCLADSGTDLCAGPFGATDDKPVLGDWDGDGQVTIGTYRAVPGVWYLDNGDGKWDLVNGIDVLMDTFGAPADIPVAGDWDGDGVTTIATYRQGQWFLGTADGFMRGTVSWNGVLIDVADASFGAPTDLPVAGDWNGDGKTQIGVYRQGQWFLDVNGNRQWDANFDTAIAAFGAPTDLPVAGDVDGDGIAEVGVYRPATGLWYFDLDNDGWTGCLADGGTDLCSGPFGAPTDKPVTGDWNGDGVAEIGVYRQGTWYLDANGNGAWDSAESAAPDTVYESFGAASDLPVTGIWQITID